MDLETLKAAIIDRFPGHAGSTFRLLPPGWHSAAVEVDELWVFKFPRNEVAAKALVREARLLTVIRPAVTISVPALIIEPGPPVFSRHRKIPGDYLLTAAYGQLPFGARDRLASVLAQFYVELHAIPTAPLRAAGAEPIEPWVGPEELLRRAWPVLEPDLRTFAEETVRAWQVLPPDPYGETFGFFDGHGWNMAFDQRNQTLNGIYDFADSGFGPVHQEFIYSNWIDPDLTARIVARYGAATGRPLDRERIHLLSGVLRLSELAQACREGKDPGPFVAIVAGWARM